MDETRRKNPKQFWRQFKETKPKTGQAISIQEFHEHFKNLSSEINENTQENVEAFLEQYDR